MKSRLFGARDKRRFEHFIDNTDPQFLRWPIHEMLKWKNLTKLSNTVVKIDGADDSILPQRANGTMGIEKSGHLTINDRAKEMSNMRLLS